MNFPAVSNNVSRWRGHWRRNQTGAADEPYAGLDSRLRERIRDDMLHVLKETGTAVLLVTHDSEEAMFMSIIFMSCARAIEQGGRPLIFIAGRAHLLPSFSVR